MKIGSRKIQFNKKAGSWTLDIPPVWVKDQRIQPGERLSFEARDGELVVKRTVVA